MTASLLNRGTAVLLLLLGTVAAAQDDPLHQGATVPAGYVAIIDGTPIPDATFIDEFVQRYTRPGEPGERMLGNLRDEAIIVAELQRRGISVSESDIDERWNELDAGLRKKGQTLGQVLE